MGFCFDGLKSGPICIGNAFSQLGDEGIGLTNAGLGLFAVVALSVFVFILKTPSSR